MLRSLITSLGLFLLAGAVSADDEAYNLRGPAPEKGQVYVITYKADGKDITRTIRANGNTIEEKFDEVASKKKEVEVLAVENGEITRLRTKIIDDERAEIVRRKNRTVKKNSERDMKGQIVYSERTAKGWKNSLEDVTPTDRQKRELKDFIPFGDDNIFYPSEKVKVGHSWKIGEDLFAKVFGSTLEDFKGSGSAKFVRVEKQDGEDVAVIEVEFEMSGKSKEEEMTLDVNMVAKGTVYRSLKHGFDRKSLISITSKIKGEGEVGEQKLELESKGTEKTDESVELKSNKK